MPASTSPYQNNDYQAVSTYRPYQLPVNDIFRAISAQNRFWEAGAQRVKSVYDNALNLDLTLDENKQIRDNYMKEAEKQLTKLSSMDLSDPSVQRKGFEIFKPLFKDKAIVMDDHLTNLQRSIYADAERYKKDDKTKGEGFHTDNLIYALKDFRGFDSKTSRKDLPDVFQKAKNSQYIPYVDVSKEYLNLADKCKPDSISKNSVQSMYFLDKSEEGKSAAGLMGCIKAGLSDKAVQQLRITGTVRYMDQYGNNDVASVAKGFQGILHGNNMAHADRILELTAEKDGLKKSNSLTPEIEKAYDAEIKSINTKITENLDASNRIDKGDYSDVDKDYDSAVGQVYGNQDIGGFAAAFAYRKYKEEYKVNMAAVTQYTQANINARQTRDIMHDDYWNERKYQQQERENDISLLKALNSDGKGISGVPYQFIKGVYQRLGLDPDETITQMLDKGKKVEGVGQTFDQINQKAEQYQHNKVQKSVELYNKLADIVGPDKKEALNSEVYNPDGSINSDKIYAKADEHIKNFYKTFNDPKLPTPDYISDLEQLMGEYQDQKTQSIEFMKIKDKINSTIDSDPNLSKIKQSSDKKMSDLIGGYEKGGQILGIENPITGGATYLTGEDLRQMMLGIHPEYKFSSEPTGSYKSTNIISRRTGKEVNWAVDENVRDVEAKTKKQVYYGAQGAEPFRKAYVDRTTKLQSAVASTVKDVVRSSLVYDASNVPGIGESLKREFTFLDIPEMADVKFSAGPSKIDQDGDLVTEVHTSYESGAGNEKKTESINKELFKAITKNSDVTTNGAIGNIKLEDGKIYVKTPYLPMAQPKYGLAETVDLRTYAASKLPLAAGQVMSEELKPVGGGFKIGFDIIGGGVDFNGQKIPNKYKPWLMKPDGTKITGFGQETTLENQLSNQLMELEKQIPAQRQKLKQ